tara:strand:+ start:205 stop:510 length:306 start_codon:yes stop_codon:yes gene_type:complete
VSKKLEGYINEATKNIREDRALASKLLSDLIQSMAGQSDHQSVGVIAAKYLETLQRSNEQLVKITSIVNRDSGSKAEISTQLKDEIYDIIKGGDQPDEEDG